MQPSCTTSTGERIHGAVEGRIYHGHDGLVFGELDREIRDSVCGAYTPSKTHIKRREIK